MSRRPAGKELPADRTVTLNQWTSRPQRRQSLHRLCGPVLVVGGLVTKGLLLAREDGLLG